MLGNILASLLIAVANILIGRFLPSAPSELIDILSMVLLLLVIGLLLIRGQLEWLRRGRLSVIVVVLITTLLIIGIGISVRWLFEGRVETAVSPVYDVYRRVYDVLAP